MIPDELPVSIRQYVTRYVHRRRWLTAACYCGWAIAGFAIWATLNCLIDRYSPLPVLVRLLTLLCGLAAVAVIIARPVAYLFRRNFNWLTATGEIERRRVPFGERLTTVVSQYHFEVPQRGSSELVKLLSDEVGSELQDEDPIRLVSKKPAVLSWIAAGVMAAEMALMVLVPTLGFPQLLQRFFTPLAKTPPVTTTRVQVIPGDAKVVEGQPFVAVASAQRLRDSSLVIHVSADGQVWNTWSMSPADAGRFTYRIPAIDRDLTYFVSGGDGKSPEYHISVLRAPSVVDFRVHYNYPAYTNRPSLTVSNTDGLIDAPVGTEASVDVRTTEPLATGTVKIDDQSFELKPTANLNVMHMKIAVTKDQRYLVQMVSRNGVRGEGPQTTSIHATADRKPLVRLIDPSDDLRLSPHDIVPLQYEALDDYGLTSLSVQVQVNASVPWQMPIKLRSDPRHQEGIYNLDLANCKPVIGDVVSLWFQATDSSKQLSISEVRHILIAPRSIDINAHQRIEEISRALQLSKTLSSEVDSARRALDDAGGQPDHDSETYLTSIARANRHLVTASETSVLIRQGMLRSILRSGSPRQATTLAHLVDASQICAAIFQDIIDARSEDNGDVVHRMRQRMDDAAGSTQQLYQWLAILNSGEQSAAILADRENVAAAVNRPAPTDKSSLESRNQIRARAQKEIADEVLALGLDPHAGDLDEQLRNRVAASEGLMNPQRDIDFVEASQDWANQFGKDGAWPEIFDRRLSAAAQAEAVRPDANLVRSRDLQLAGKAAEKLSSSSETVGRVDVQKHYPQAMEAMKRDQELYAGANDIRPPDEIASVRKHADEARALMQKWAGDEASDSIADANAAAAQHDYDRVRQIDQTRVSTTGPSLQDSVARDMNIAQKIDQTTADQNQLTKQTAVAKADQAKGLAGQQNELADRIDELNSDTEKPPVELTSGDPVDVDRGGEDPQWRDEQGSSLSKLQEQLAAMPGELTTVEQQFTETQHAAKETAEAEKWAEDADEVLKPAAERTAAAARQAEDNARSQLDDVSQAVSPGKGEEIANELAKFSPDSEASTAAVNEQLLPALRSLQQVMKANDVQGVTRTMDDVRRAIEAVQEQLAAQQQRLMERDPLVVAKWYAKNAAAALSRTPPDIAAAQRNQKGASKALERAWDVSIHNAAAGRLASLQSMSSLFSLFPLRGDASGGSGTTSGKASATALPRDWGRLQARDNEGMSAPAHEIDPPGYEDALRVYFDALSQPGGGKK